MVSGKPEGRARPKKVKKYLQYELPVDPNQNDKAKEIHVCDFSRPHMRAFHCSWWSFFIAFFNWFAITPLLPHIQKDLGLSKKDIWASSLASIAGTILIRLILGPLCDKYGARVLFSALLCATAIPTACIGFIQTGMDLIIARLFIGLAGGAFVMCEYWSSMMFAEEIAGTANALVAGWGNLGAGITQLLIGSALYPLFIRMCSGDSEMAWRTVCVVPAIISFLSGVLVYFISDDSPKGNYSELKKLGEFPDISLSRKFSEGLWDRSTMILFIQYACCFGVELTMNSVAVLYFKEEFGQSTVVATAIASIFGWMNMFARGFGGFLCDFANARYGIHGRLMMHMLLLACEGGLVMTFAAADSLAGTIVILVFFSFFVQATEGSSFGIVPLINPSATGAITGIVGAGGNFGAVCFGLLFREMDYKISFRIMGACVLGSAVSTFFIPTWKYDTSTKRRKLRQFDGVSKDSIISEIEDFL